MNETELNEKIQNLLNEAVNQNKPEMHNDTIAEMLMNLNYNSVIVMHRGGCVVVYQNKFGGITVLTDGTSLLNELL